MKKKKYTKPELEKMFVTADAVLASDEGGSSGEVVAPTPEEDEGPIHWFSLG